MKKKYELVMNDSIITDDSIRLYRIRALKDFNDIKAGELGGYISGYHNLSHEGNCWIYGDAKVYGWAKVSDDAKVYGNARVYGWSNIRNDAEICDNAIVYGNATICDNVKVVENVKLCDYVELYGDACISSDKDYLYVKGLGSMTRSTTAFKLSDGSIYIISGSFGGTLDEFETMLKNNNRYRMFMRYINTIRNHFNLS